MFYDNYTRLCKERGETPTAVARKMGCASSNLAMWKKGSVPRAAILQQFADYFSVSTQYLLFGDDENNEKSPAVQLNSEGDPVMEELLQMIRSATEEERRDMLNLIQIIQKRRKED